MLFNIKRKMRSGATPLLLLLALSNWAAASPACAAEAIAKGTPEAIARSLGFLESAAPRDGRFALAVVYAQEVPGAKAAAEDAAGRLSKLAGPKYSQIQAVPYDVEHFLQSKDHIDAAFLTTEVVGNAAVSQFIRERNVLSIASDSACLSNSSCVLMVSAERNVKITLNTKLADHLGAEFSSVFTMMVNRQ